MGLGFELGCSMIQFPRSLVMVAVLFSCQAYAEQLISVQSNIIQPETSNPQNNTTEATRNDAQSQIEEAAKHFDSFALLMPSVIAAKLKSFAKNGFKAILLEDPTTKPIEEEMIGSLIKALQAIGDSLSKDLVSEEWQAQHQQNRKIMHVEHPVEPGAQLTKPSAP